MSFLSQPLQDILIKPARKIGNISLQVVVTENTTDTLTVTKQPVQMGATIGDHAYMEPTAFAHSIYFSSATTSNAFGFGSQNLNQLYQKLQDLQSSAVPFDIVTPKRLYKNMLMTTLSQTTDKLTENCLSIHASYQQIFLVQIVAGTVPRINQKSLQTTAKTENTGNVSLLQKVLGGG